MEVIDTKPIFIVGSGRSGTYQISELLKTYEHISSHHEYLFEYILKKAVLRRMALLDNQQLSEAIKETYVPAIKLSRENIWVDSSNALPWIIDDLFLEFPDAKFIFLVRDGRKVVSSFYNKFSEVMYAEDAVDSLSKWINNPTGEICPPPEKKYWRPLPLRGERFFELFSEFNQFQRICYYWQDLTRNIIKSFENKPVSNYFIFKFEDLISNDLVLKDFLSHFEISEIKKARQVLKHPVNVHMPVNFKLDPQQEKEYFEICGDMHSSLGYDGREEYSVEY